MAVRILLRRRSSCAYRHNRNRRLARIPRPAGIPRGLARIDAGYVPSSSEPALTPDRLCRWSCLRLPVAFLDEQSTALDERLDEFDAKAGRTGSDTDFS